MASRFGFGLFALIATVLIGCSGLVDSIIEPGAAQFQRAVALVETVREASIEVLAAVADDAPCRAEWRRLAADATDTMQRAEAIYRDEVQRALMSARDNSQALLAGADAQFRAARDVRNRIAPALDATLGCVERGGLTMEEWVELEAAGRRPDAGTVEPVQRDAAARIVRPVA